MRHSEAEGMSEDRLGPFWVYEPGVRAQQFLYRLRCRRKAEGAGVSSASRQGLDDQVTDDVGAGKHIVWTEFLAS